MANQKVKLPIRVNGFFDARLNRMRYLVRPVGRPAVTLPGLPWSPVFMAAHEAAMAGQPVTMTALPIGAARVKPGTLSDAILRFYEHELFTNLGAAHQARHRQKLEKFRQEKTANDIPRGDRLLQGFTHDALVKMLKDIESPNAQRHLLNALRALMKFCKMAKLIQVDPTADLKGKRRPKTDGFKRAAEDEIEIYQRHHALGTMPRLALELMLNTGLRRSDAVCLGRQHVSDGVITIKTQKTGATVMMPMHSDLQAALAAMPARETKPGDATALTFLVSGHGKAFTVAGFGNWFRDQCVAAGVSFRAHGLRKAICIRLVRQGMTPHQVAAITGHTDLREIELYAKEYDREVAAQQAMAALEKRKAAR